MTVQTLLATTTSHELAEWQAYFRVENERHDEQAKEAEAKRKGKVTAKDPAMLSEALKMQLSTKKAGG